MAESSLCHHPLGVGCLAVWLAYSTIFHWFEDKLLAERLNFFVCSGGDAKRVMIDLGIGFGKALEHNLALLQNLETFVAMGLPVVLGVSRKSFLGKILSLPDPAQRLEGSLAVACWAQLKGVAVLRVHDVRSTRLALDVLAAVQKQASK